MKYISSLFLITINAIASNAQNPKIKVIDTDFSKGRLTNQQTISLDDAGKFHGHLCDGLVVGFIGLKEAFNQLYPQKIIDRTNTRIVSRSSPCLTDIAIYLSGGRYQYNTFYVSDSIAYSFIVQRIDNGISIGVNLKPGIKPTAIDSLGALANKGKLDACQLDKLHELENKFADFVLNSNPKDLFNLTIINTFNWNSTFQTFPKTDILNKQLQPCK